MRALVCLSLLLFAGLAFAGDLTHRENLTLNRVLQGGPPYYTEELLLADVVPQPGRRFTNFSGDLSGRYIEALAAWSRYTGRRFPQLDGLVSQVLAHQKADGHFGDAMRASGGIADDDMARMWGNGRMLIGLIEYYRLTQKPEVLAAARRLGDFLVSQAPSFNSDDVQARYSGPQVATGYICWTQNVEGLAALLQLTSDIRYRELAGQLAARTKRYPRQHSHGFLTSLRGILLLYEATREKAYLEQVENEWHALSASENLLLQGGLPEVLAPGIERDEGCSEADWVRLSLQLWRVTAKNEYLEQAEYTYFNEFSFNQFASGDFGHHKFSAAGFAFESARAWWCCTLHGLRAFVDIASAIFRAGDGSVYLDLPLDGQIKIPGGTVSAESSLEKDGSVRIAAKGRAVKLAIRLENWGDGIEVRRASKGGANPLRAVNSDGYLRLEQELKPGESVVVRYTMRTRIQPDSRHPRMVAIFHGPWLLGVNERTSPYFFDEPYSPNQRLLTTADANGRLQLEAGPAASAREAFVVPVAHRSVRFVPGGYALQPTAVILRPIAEKAAADLPARWQFLFRLEYLGK